ncbi:hypothetical protein FO519_004656 [Halicephalobus sp. NKZ332]|nr:hypothetical protein FO519_004656 [Halicephalobus sp. NKZ332]
MTSLRILHEINNYVASSLGLLCNCFIIYIIIKTSNPELKKYSRILFQSAISDVLLNFVNIVICPILIITNNVAAVSLTPIVDVGKKFQGILFVTCAIHAYYGFCVRTEGDFYMAEGFAPWFSDEGGRVNAIGITGTFDNYFYILLVHSSLNIIGCYCVVIWCSWSVYKYLSRTENRSHTDCRIMEVQKQVLCLNKKFTLKLHLTCLLIAEFIAAGYATHMYYAFCIRTEDKLYMAESFAPWFGDQNGKVNAIGITGTFDKYFPVIMTYSFLNVGGCYGVIILCSRGIFKYMNQLKNTPHANRHICEMQKQLMKILIIQAIIPLITFCMPLTLILITLLFRFTIPEHLAAVLGLMLAYIPTVHVIDSYVVSSVGLILNSFIIYIIIKVPNTELKKYSRILLQSTIFDVMLNIVNIVICPIIIITHDFAAISVDPLVNIGPHYQAVLFGIWVLVLYLSISTIPIAFYFRYVVVCLSKQFTSKLYAICLSMAGFVAITYAIHAYYGFCVRTEGDFYMAEGFAPWFSDEDGRVNAIGIIGTATYLTFNLRRLSKKMAFLRILHAITNYTISSLSLICNSFMIYTIIKASNAELKKYSRILLQSAIFDIWLNVINILICPILITTHNMSVIPLNPILHVICLLIGEFIGTVYAVNVYYGFCIRTKDNFDMAESFAPWFAGDDGRVNTIGITGSVGFCHNLRNSNFNFKFDKYFYVLLAHTSLNIIIYYCVIMWCSYNIYKYQAALNNMPHTNQQILEVQKQLAKMLIVQAVVPLITFLIPGQMMFLTLLFGINIPESLSTISGFLLTWIPLGNALSMLFVKNYRNFGIRMMKDIFGRVFCRKYDLSIHPHALPSSSELKKYSRILLQSAIFDLWLNVMNIIICPIIITAHNIVVIPLNPFVDVGEYFLGILFGVWLLALYSSICGIPIAFFFRYTVLCLNKRFTLKLRVICLLAAGFISTIYAIHAYYGFCMRTKDYFYMAELFAPWFADGNGRVSTVGILGTFDTYCYILLAHSCFNVVGCYCIIIWCSYNIYKYLARLQNTPHTDHHILEVQKQLAKTLIFQAVIPLITFCVPANMIFLTVICKINVPEYISADIGLMLTYIPLGNALSIFFFVKAYRNFGIQLFRKIPEKIIYWSS